MLALQHHCANTMREALLAPAGFAWWYAEWRGPGGEAAVLIASFGLPFLPDPAPVPAFGRPCLSLATYRNGRPSFYLLQQYPPLSAPCGGEVWLIGQSELRLDHLGDRCELRAKLDVALPGGGALRGEAWLEGPSPALPSGEGPHRWMPLAPHARGSFALGSETIEGRAYLDANCSFVPLGSLGIADWHWGRVAFPDHELVFYLCNAQTTEEAPVALALRVDRDGRTTRYENPVAHWLEPRRSVYGLSYHRRLRLESSDGLDITIELRHLVDDGPFYLRFLSEGRCAQSGAVGSGTAERVVPDRIDRPFQRPFVRMRRHRVGGDNSLWLPLFSGPRNGRVARLMRHWWQEMT